MVAEPGTAGQSDPLSWRELRRTMELQDNEDIGGVVVALQLVWEMQIDLRWEVKNDLRWETQNSATNLGSMQRQLETPKVIAPVLLEPGRSILLCRLHRCQAPW